MDVCQSNFEIGKKLYLFNIWSNLVQRIVIDIKKKVNILKISWNLFWYTSDMKKISISIFNLWAEIFNST